MPQQRDCVHGRLARACEICELQDEIAELKVKLSICRQSHQVLQNTIATQRLEIDRLKQGSQRRLNGNF